MLSAVLYFTAKNEILELLDLSWNHIRGKGAISIGQSLKVGKGAISIGQSLKVGSCAISIGQSLKVGKGAKSMG